MTFAKIIYAITISICAIIMLLIVRITRRRNTRITKSLCRLDIVCMITMLSGAISILIQNEFWILLTQNLHTMATEWVLLFLLAFLTIYTNIPMKNKIVFSILGSISIIDTCVFALNTIFKNALDVTYVIYEGVVYTEFIEKAPWYPIHMYFSYILALICLYKMIEPLKKSPKVYRSKYYPIAIAFVLTLAMEVICDIREVKLDVTLFAYFGLVMYLTYHSVYHTFKGLITNTLSEIVVNMENGVVCFDINNKCIYANDIAKKVYHNAKKLSDFEQIMIDYLGHDSFQDADEFQKLVEIETANNEIRSYELTFSKLIDDDDGKYIGCYLYCDDRTQNIVEFNEANYKATHDVLTGLCNKELFENRVAANIKVNGASNYYMITADIKDFKIINDIFGNEKGDEVLIAVANVLTQAFQNKAIACRTNSDRFGFCVLKNCFSEAALYNAVKVIASRTLNDNFQFIMHFGVYKMTDEDASVDVSVMYDRSRMALQSIKANYQKCIAYYDDSMMNNLIKEREYVGMFDSAIAEEQFVMFLQPQIVPSGEMVGAEALVRWNHPEYGMISPGVFIPIFENTGLIHRLDLYMWEQAAKTLVKWQNMGYSQYYISVNISPTDFYHLDIYKVFVDLVNRYSIDPKRLKLEITESSFMRDPETQLSLIAKLQDYGFHVEIDDFGSGYSSLNMLKDMKADVLKIDMGFLRETESVDRTKIILNMIIELAKKLNMIIVVEGVETQDQVVYLTTAGCDLLQGYYFDKPIDIDTFEKKYFK